MNHCEVAKLGLLSGQGYRAGIWDATRSKFDFKISKNDPKITHPVAVAKV